MKDQALPSVKIVFEFPETEASSNLIRFDSWEYGLSSEDMDAGMDLRVRLDREWILVDKYYLLYLRKNRDTGKMLTPVGEWKTVFIIRERRVIYIATENVAFC